MITKPLEVFNAYLERAEEKSKRRLAARLHEVALKYKADGFLLAECQMLDSSRIGQRVFLPYGGQATMPEVPTTPFSPRGLASDTSVVIGHFTYEEFCKLRSQDFV